MEIAAVVPSTLQLSGNKEFPPPSTVSRQRANNPRRGTCESLSLLFGRFPDQE
jgi:hypothetical protein